MATKDDRKIVSNVRLGGEVYGPGREDELAAVLEQERLDELVASGVLEGTWQAGATTQAAEAGDKASSKSTKSKK